ncbi:hypothetical protein EDD86DRAFT_207829, partial [Gorgonomyces haynaldii]
MSDDSDMMDATSDDYFFDEDEDSNFEPVVPEASIKKIYEVDFQVYSPEDILAFQKAEIAHVQGIIGGSLDTAATLLRSFSWNKEKMIESYIEDPDKVTEQAGVILDVKRKPRLEVVPGFVCDICCNDDPELETLALGCNHRFCKDCYEHYLTMKIAEEGESRRISCPADCRVIVGRETIKMMVKPKVFEKYEQLLLRTYVDDRDYLKWCPYPNCEYCVECKVGPNKLDEIVPTVICRSGHRFCFGCGVKDHQPSTCHLVKLWLKKCADDSETANWIAANTKECVKCGSTIEKNGGCNHMTCKKCKTEFCWVCLGPWSEHGTQWYNCNRYDEKNSVEARDSQAKSRQALERYLHYYNRYANHEQSAKLDQDLYAKTEQKMEEMQHTSELSWIEVQFLKKAVQVLLESRATLQWTYCFAFYLQRNNHTELFEDNQRDLEMAVEHLSELLENPLDPTKIHETKQLVLDKTAYVNSRREVLLSDTCRGLLEGRWQYKF